MSRSGEVNVDLGAEKRSISREIKFSTRESFTRPSGGPVTVRLAQSGETGSW